MRELRSRVIITEWSKSKMFQYADIFCEISKPGGDDSKHIERQ